VPAVQGDPRLIRILLENLIGNAWKFTSRRDDARIEFGALEGTPTTYYLRDNGAGFDMEHAGKLFGVFQRLHVAREFPGTGIGLATVQRIVRRHGGRVWAEGEVERGACFYFTLTAS
jgi:light-regulated signal transduction histidine kinase (bacteriophytochrome)